MTDVGNIITVRGIAISGSYRMPLPLAHPDGSQYCIQILYKIDTNVITVGTGTDRSSWTGYAIVEYTKTT